MSAKRILAEIERRFRDYMAQGDALKRAGFDYVPTFCRADAIECLRDWIIALPPDDLAAELADAKAEVTKSIL